MKNLFLRLILFIPLITFSQEDVSTQIYSFDMPIELDKDTTYYYRLDSDYANESMNGVENIYSCEYNNSSSALRIGHQFSLNCCTEHFYKIIIKGDSINISSSQEGDYCLCGSQYYILTYVDENPQKEKYHISSSYNDTIVSKTLNLYEIKELEAVNFYYSSVENKIHLHVESVDKQFIYVSLLDINGRIIVNKSMTELYSTIDTKLLPSGIYIIKLDLGKETITKKILIKK